MKTLPGTAAGRAVMFTGALLTGLAHAGETDKIATDRPDFVESSVVVGRAIVQIETSVAQERNKANGLRERTFSTPSLLRVGVSDSVELRLETDGHMVMHTDSGATSTSERGYADASFGVKWHALDAKGALPSLGWLAHLDLASGSRAFRGRRGAPLIAHVRRMGTAL